MVYKVYRSRLPALSDCQARTNVRADHCEKVCVFCHDRSESVVMQFPEDDPDSFLINNTEKEYQVFTSNSQSFP